MPEKVIFPKFKKFELRKNKDSQLSARPVGGAYFSKFQKKNELRKNKHHPVAVLRAEFTELRDENAYFPELDKCFELWENSIPEFSARPPLGGGYFPGVMFLNFGKLSILNSQLSTRPLSGA